MTTAVQTPRRRSARLVGLVVASVAVLTVLTLAFLVFVLPAAAGGTARSVQSGSMAPALPVGSLVIDRPVDPTALHVGDIATYRQHADGVTRYVTHRIVRVTGPASALQFTFRGDANSSADPRPVPASAISGKVWMHLPYVGGLSDRLTRLRWMALALGVLALAAYSAWQIAGGLREHREEKA